MMKGDNEAFVREHGLELLCRTEEELLDLAVPCSPWFVLRALASPPKSERHVNCLGELMAHLEDGFPVPIPPDLLHGSFLLLIHMYLLVCRMTGSLDPARRPADHTLGKTLFLDRPATWSAADALVPVLYDRNGVPQAGRTLRALNRHWA